MSILNFLFPQNYHFPDSKYNKNISVLAYLNSATLMADGLVESGEVMVKVWRKAIKTLLPKSFNPKHALLLGLAGGSNAHLLNRYFPQCYITAVEIDPFMIKLGERFFNLKKVKNLKINIGDALNYVNSLKDKDKFDLAMVDCFVGKEIPKKLENIDFLKKLKQHSRFVLINRLWWQKEKIITSNFFRSIEPHFFFIKTHTISNAIISLI